MSTVRRFEDLVAWQKARVLTREIYKVMQQEGFAKDYGLSSQIQRASVSIMPNIAEGYERSSRGEFHHFLFTAKASCAEVRSQLYIAVDVGYLSETEFKRLMALAEKAGKIIGGLRASVERSRNAQRE